MHLLKLGNQNGSVAVSKILVGAMHLLELGNHNGSVAVGKMLVGLL